MPPSIYIDGKLVAKVPDQSGTYDSEIGEITVDSSEIGPGKGQRVVSLGNKHWRSTDLSGPRSELWLPKKYVRHISLSKEGVGSNPIGGDRLIEVRLEQPIETRDGARYYPDYPEASSLRRRL